MEGNDDVTYLDQEFKRYLQLLRPYLGQLIDQDVIHICDAWIKRLSDCKEKERVLRNKFVFTLCYQLAEGILDHPFLNYPPSELQPISDGIVSEDSSVELGCLPINSKETANILFDAKKASISESEYISEEDEKVVQNPVGIKCVEISPKHLDNNYNEDSLQPQLYCHTCPEVQQRACKISGVQEYRANNLVKKLREIKIQNILLQRELEALKQESFARHNESGDDSIMKVDNATSILINSQASNYTLKSLKYQLSNVQESRKSLIQSISQLQDKLDNYDEIKKNELEEIKIKHELDLISLRSAIQEERNNYYGNKIEKLRIDYEKIIKEIHDKSSSEIKQIHLNKDEIINEKIKTIEIKDAEIICLKNQLEEQKSSLHSVLNKFIEKPLASDSTSYDNVKIRAQHLEKRLIKIEKSKAKCAKMYEAKLAQVQREKHLAECSLQLQLVRQRAQVVSEMADESQTELRMSLDKLETKYKDIVANVQATALQRRLQDQMALDSIFQAAYGINSRSHSQLQQVAANNPNQSYGSEISSLTRGNKIGSVIVGNKTFAEDLPVYCLNGERMGELFERVCIPQRDGAPK